MHMTHVLNVMTIYNGTLLRYSVYQEVLVIVKLMFLDKQILARLVSMDII